MEFIGITREFSLENEGQYDTIGAFWDEMTQLYGLESLQGLGYGWKNRKILYAIGFKNGVIPGADLKFQLPDQGWVTVHGETDRLKEIYDEIYQSGPLTYEIETFGEDGQCEIRYYRA